MFASTNGVGTPLTTLFRFSCMASNLRSKLIRLAHTNPGIRPHLLPILKKGQLSKVAWHWSDALDTFRSYFDETLEKLQRDQSDYDEVDLAGLVKIFDGFAKELDSWERKHRNK